MAMYFFHGFQLAPFGARNCSSLLEPLYIEVIGVPLARESVIREFFKGCEHAFRVVR